MDWHLMTHSLQVMNTLFTHFHVLCHFLKFQKLFIRGLQNHDFPLKSADLDLLNLLYKLSLWFLRLGILINYLAQALPDHLSHSILYTIYEAILHHNLDLRKDLLRICTPFIDPFIVSLSSIVKREIALIETNIHYLSSAK